MEQFYYPEGWGGAALPRDVTLHLRSNGYGVEVVCGSEPYVEVKGDPGPDPEAAGIRLRRIPRLLAGDIHRHKLLRQFWFYVAMLPALFLRRPPGVFVSQTNPPLAVVLVGLAARLFNRPFVIIAQDLYPESMVAHGMVREGSLAERVLTRIFGWSYRSAQRIIALGDVMRARLEDKGVSPARIEVISNWATGPEGVVSGTSNALREEWGLTGKFVLLYSGNLGLGHEFETMLDGFAMASREVPNLELVFIGRGSRLDEVMRSVRERSLGDRVQFRDFVPMERLPESLGLADVALVTLRPGFEGLIVPSKLLGYMARGVPTLYIGPKSDVSALIEGADCGVVAAPGDAESVRAAIVSAASDRPTLRRRGENGLRYYEQRLARSHGLKRYEAVVARALAAGRS